MPHTIQIQSAVVVDDAVTVTGTVDGQSVTVQVWKSHLDTFVAPGAKRLYVAQQLLNALPSSPVDLGLSGTVTI